MGKHSLICGLALSALVVAGAGCVTPEDVPAVKKDVFGSAAVTAVATAKDATYLVDGEPVTLVDGLSEREAVPSSASKTVTRYFGNDATGDLDGDGDEDIVLWLTQEGGGTGIFYYVAAAIRTSSGYQGTNAILLGDRIAPQSTEISGGRITVNFADRRADEPFSSPPSVGVSKRFRVADGDLVALPDPAADGVGVVPAGRLTEAEARIIAERSCIKGGESLVDGYHNDYTNTWWFDANLNSAQEGCNPACVVSDETRQAEINWRCTGLKLPGE